MKEVYPELNNPKFTTEIANLEEFNIFNIPKLKPFQSKEEFEKRSNELCQFEKTYYQHFVSQYLSRRSPYRGLLLYHGLGSGKTCSAVTIAETLQSNHLITEEPSVWVISRKALKDTFEQEIFQTSMLLNKDSDFAKQCTGDMYYKLIPNADKMTQDKLLQRINKIIKSKYTIFGYVQFANMVNQWKEDKVLQDKIHNKIIIIDEAHNIRNIEALEGSNKRIVEPLIDVLKNGTNNRLVLLSATPMYNEPEEILWLMSLLLINDHREGILDPYNLPTAFTTSGEINENIKNLCIQLSKTYISYVRGNNPFTFATRLDPPSTETNFVKEVPHTILSGEKLDKNEEKWLSWIPGKLVASPLGQLQLDAITAYEERKKNKISTATLRQINICAYKKLLGKDNYEYQEGKDGLLSVLTRSDKSEPVQFKYINSNEQIFDPSYGNLSLFATKLNTLNSIIKSSKGIVLIYSMFIYGGILPISIMLEHMGFSRYKERNILKTSVKSVSNKQSIKYDGIQNPKYCIISSESDKEIMGDSKISDLLKDINSEENKNGENIKVVIISPVAGEGLSFKNIREMHIIDPWYHLNNQEQAIGRAIRNCSHSTLPIEERNVTVYLHSTVYPDNSKETSDLHAYRLSANKYIRIQNLYSLIHSNAVDCKLMKNINYFPKELFDFNIMMRTSRNQQIPYRFGDEIKDEIKCSNNKDKQVLDVRSFREESYATFIPTLQQKLKKYIENNETNIYEYEHLLKIVHPNREIGTKVIESVLYPFKLKGNKYMIYHNGKFIVSTISKDVSIPTRLLYVKEEIEKKEVDTECKLEEVLEQMNKYEDNEALLKIYQSLDSKCWAKFAEDVVLNKIKNIDKITKSIRLLEKEGAFILKSEIPSETTPSNYSGYINLFSKEDEFEAYIWDNYDKQFRLLTTTELNKVKGNREAVEFTNPTKTKIKQTQGVLVRYKNKKEPNAAYTFQFKLLLSNETGKRSGVTCSSLKKPQIVESLKQYIKKPIGNVEQLCSSLMLELYNNDKLWLPPIYKNKNVIKK